MTLQAALLVLAAASADAPMAPGQASGTVTVGDYTFRLATAYLRPLDGHGVEVLAADRPLPEDRLDGEVSLERAASIAKADFLYFILREERVVIWRIGSPQGGGPGEGWDEAFTFAADGGPDVSGRLKVEPVIDAFGRRVSLDGRLRARRVEPVEPPARTTAEREARALLKSKGYGLRRTDFFQASFADPALVPTFLAAGLPADTRFPETDQTLLMSILNRERDCDTDDVLGMLRALLAAGANPNEREEQWGMLQDTPLASAYPCTAEMGLLVDAGARLGEVVGDPKAGKTVGASQMAQAIEDDDAEVVGFLIARGFDVRPGGSALLKAAAGKAEITSLLRKAGARPAASRPSRRGTAK
jgi:hypothetical protein